MITQETAMLIWDAYREISAAEKLLNDISEYKKWEPDRYAPSLKDAFGRRRHLELGIPSRENGHRLLQVSPDLADAVIRAHMAHAKAKLADANERARIELSTSSPDLCSGSEGPLYTDGLPLG